MIALTTKEAANRLKCNPLIIHMNPLGLFKMGKDNPSRFLNFNKVLNKIQENGGNIAVPVYSYSYTKKEVYDLINTASALDSLSEYLRRNNAKKRTIDPNFSYLMFGDGFSSRHSQLSNYSTFGDGSLIDEVYKKGGYLGAVGGALEYLTEIHYLERKLNLSYRHDKIFKGYSIDSSGTIISSKATHFCRDLESDYMVSFVQLKKDIRLEGLTEIWELKECNLRIEVIKIQKLYNFIKEKLQYNPKYLWKGV